VELEREIVIKWLHKASEELVTGEEMLFPAGTDPDQKDKRKAFIKELRIFSKIDPIAAAELQITARFRDHRFWIVIKKIAFSPLIAFKKGRNGKVIRIIIEDDAEKLRRIGLMKEDGYLLEDIEEMEGGLSKEEVDFLKRERR
jgi:hypothetical protein